MLDKRSETDKKITTSRQKHNLWPEIDLMSQINQDVFVSQFQWAFRLQGAKVARDGFSSAVFKFLITDAF